MLYTTNKDNQSNEKNITVQIMGQTSSSSTMMTDPNFIVGIVVQNFIYALYAAGKSNKKIKFFHDFVQFKYSV